MKYFVCLLTGQVKSHKQLLAISNSKIIRIRRQVASYFEPDTNDLSRLPRRTRRGLMRKLFKAQYGKVKF